MNSEISDVLAAIAETRASIKKAFLPMPGDMPQQMAPGGAPPMDPAMAAQGAPPPGAMPPGAMPPGGAPPMDPAMAAQGAAPVDPAAAQGALPPGAQPDSMQIIEQVVQGLEELFGLVQQLGQAVDQLAANVNQQEQKIGVIVNELSQPAPMPAGAGAQPMM